MAANHEYRDRDPTEVAVLDALLNRGDEGMTVLELRTAVSIDIDELETALESLKEAGLITVDYPDGNAVIKPADHVTPTETEDEDQSLGDWLRERIPL